MIFPQGSANPSIQVLDLNVKHVIPFFDVILLKGSVGSLVVVAHTCEDNHGLKIKTNKSERLLLNQFLKCGIKNEKILIISLDGYPQKF